MISEHESKALDHPRIAEFHKFYSEYHFWLEVGPERLRLKIRIYETSDGRFYFVQSHYVQVSSKDSVAGTPTILGHPSPHLALSTAIESITTYYDEAVASGEEPNLGWFVPNEHF